MNIDELYNATIKTIEDVSNGIDKQALVISNDLLSSIINRIQSSGTGADGAKFKPYSKNQLPVSYYEDRILRGSRFDTFKKTKKTASYEEIRRDVEGLRVDIKDFTYSGQMFGQTGVTINSRKNGAVAIVGGQTPYARELYVRIKKQQGYTLLQLSTAELNLGKQMLSDWVENILTKNKIKI